jgi:hypothetical protein
MDFLFSEITQFEHMKYALEILTKQIKICEFNLCGVNGIIPSNSSQHTLKTNLKELKRAIKLINNELDLESKGKIEKM